MSDNIKLFATVLFYLIILQVNSQSKDSLLSQWKDVSNRQIQLVDTAKMQLLNDLAISYKENQPDSSIYYAKLVLDMADSSLFVYRIDALKTITSAYYIISDPKLCHDYSQQLIQLAEQIDDQKTVLHGKLYTGLAYMHQDKVDESIKLFDEYLKLAETLRDTISLARGFLNQSINYDAREAYKKALDVLAKSIHFSDAIGDTYYKAMAYDRRGYIHSDLKQYQKAVDNHLIALEIMDSDNDWEKAFAYAGLAQAYLGLKNYGKSTDYGKKSVDLAVKMDAKWDIQNSAMILYQAYEQSGDFKNALYYHKMYKTYYDSIYSEANERKIHALQLGQVELERETLQQENALQQQILQQRNTQLILILGLLAFFLLIIIGLYYVFSSKKKFAEQLAIQHKQLDDLNKMKDRILSILAHDMRGPMQSVMAIVHLIKHDKANINIDELVDLVHERISVVSHSLNSILEWSLRTFKGGATTQEVMDVNEVIKEQIDLCNYDVDQKQLNVEFEPKEVSRVQVEGEHLRIIIRNILSNAIKFTDRGGAIRITYRDLGSQLAIDIEDTGMGMSPEKVDNLFISRGKTKMGTDREIGTGLGLFLCKEYAEMNGGTIDVNSKLNQGTTFSLVLNKA